MVILGIVIADKPTELKRDTVFSGLVENKDMWNSTINSCPMQITRGLQMMMMIGIRKPLGS